MRLRDKVALLIGCSPNIGRSIARTFAKEGALVAVNDIKEVKGRETVSLIEKAGGKAAFISVDISTSEGLKEAVSFAVDTFGRLDIFVSLANFLVLLCMGFSSHFQFGFQDITDYTMHC